MSERTDYPCRIVTPDGVAFEGDVQMTLVTGVGGDMGALASHAPLVGDLRMGSVKVQLPDDSWKVWASREGFVKVHDSSALVLVEDAVATDAITEEMARQVIERGETELAKATEQSAAAEKREDEKYREIESDEDIDPYQADIRTAEARVAWGNHLLELAGTTE